MKRKSDSRKLDRVTSVRLVTRPPSKTLARFAESKRKLYFFLFHYWGGGCSFEPSFTGKATGPRLGDKQQEWRN